MESWKGSVPVDRYCDLVMKGGITSGVVYPSAIATLAQVYRFKSIGGTSVGAIAAVLTAAAEYRRWKGNGDISGFDELAKLRTELGEKGKLISMFQPVPGCRRLFKVLVTALNARNHLTRFWLIVLGLMRGYWLVSALSVAIAAGIGMLSASVCAGVLSWFVSWLALTGWSIRSDLSGPVVDAGYGLCSGRDEPPAEGRKRDPRAPRALMPWLHDLVQRVAGLNETADPLTFRDLWTAGGDRFPPLWLPGAQPHAIELRLFTTNVSHGRPYLLPFDSETKPLYYLRSELKRCVPDEIEAFLEKKWNALAEKPPLPRDADPELRVLPCAEDLPIVLAARMSMSFPLLFTAVPLWAGHDCRWACSQPPKRASVASGLRRCWFSDGGISSNFPVHLFDDLLPLWPTFGIQLDSLPHDAPEHEAKDMVLLPHSYDSGYEERWNTFDRQNGYASFSGFLFAVVGTMQNWNDNTLSRMPGVRDRVVRLGTFEHEGGLNLDMKPEVVKCLSERGEEAAKALLARYGPQPDGRPWGAAGTTSAGFASACC